jgi:cytochrome c oxidase cbb3-type subunit 3
MDEKQTGGPGDQPEADRLLDHDVDGIREYDNPLPRWWVNLFWATIVFAILYAANVIPGVGSGQGRIANYEREIAEATAKREALAAQEAPVTAEAILAMAANPAGLAAAKERFVGTCAPCHRADGGGAIGPNLTDDFWIHGGGPLQVHKTIHDGVPEKGMPAWGQVLKPEEVPAVAAYVLSLYGSNPVNAKEPQGERIAR